MACRVLFRFKYEDVTRSMVVRNSWVTQSREAAGFIDGAVFDALEGQGDNAIKAWIDDQLDGTVAAVLPGTKTCGSRWVQYEIDKSTDLALGFLGIDVSKTRVFAAATSERCGKIAAGYSRLWNNDDGYTKLGSWTWAAAMDVGK